MATIKEIAEVYEPPQTYNIADLDRFTLDLEMHDGKGKNAEGEEFTYSYVKLDGKEYRVPNPVIEKIQDILKLKPDVNDVRVIRTGSGIATKYKVEFV